MAKLTGKSGSVTIAGNSLNFTKFGNNVARVLADVTDSQNYDVGTDLLWPAQLPVSGGVEVECSGWYDTSITAAALTALLFSGATAVLCSIKFSTGTTFGHGLFDVTDFKTDNPVDNTVGYSVKLKSNGVFVPNS